MALAAGSLVASPRLASRVLAAAGSFKCSSAGAAAAAAGKGSKGCILRLVAAAAGGESVDVQDPILPSGEWPENFSILNYEDLTMHLEPSLFKAEAQPSTFLADVMSKDVFTVSPEHLLETVDHYFTKISGLPVIDKEFRCVGVLSRKDRSKASKGLKSPVSEVMSSPAITLSADKTVSDAAVLMLKNKIHRIPIVNNSNQVIGVVTRTDIFTAMESTS